MEERHPELALEFLELNGDRWQAKLQAVSCRKKVAVFGHQPEGS